MKVLSLFDGISCGRVALERAGIEVEKYYASEINPYSIQIAKKNYPSTIEIGDVRDIETIWYKDCDLLIGGSPCQNFSFAGRRNGASTKENIKIVTLEQYMDYKKKGFEFDGYSYLFWEYVRVLKELKPKYFLLENVRMSKEWEAVITETLGVKPIMINSSLVSAQSRHRLYWTNIEGITQPTDKGLLLKDVLKDTYSEKEVLSDLIQSRFKLISNSKSACGTTKPEFRKIGERDVVYGDNNKMGCLVATDYKQPKQVYHNGVLRKISPEEAELLQTLPEGYTSGISNTRRFECIGNGWTVDVISHIFSFINTQQNDLREVM
jgi:DNA (cytosine-5)-methyltransferase 3A